MIIIGDIHGCYETLMKLLEKLPEDEICFVGDFIDRGPASLKVLDFMMDSGHHCVMGNHEHLMLDYYRNNKKTYGELTWMMTGGVSTIQEYQDIEDANDGDTSLREKHLTWLESLPFYLEFPNIKNEAGEYLIVSHSAIVTETLQEAVDDRSIMWTRKMPELNNGTFNIFGHTPVDDVNLGAHYANVDTGACYEKKMTAIQFPSMEVFEQEYCG